MEINATQQRQNKVSFLSHLYKIANINTSEQFYAVYNTTSEDVTKFLNPDGVLPLEWLDYLFSQSNESIDYESLQYFIDKMNPMKDSTSITYDKRSTNVGDTGLQALKHRGIPTKTDARKKTTDSVTKPTVEVTPEEILFDYDFPSSIELTKFVQQAFKNSMLGLKNSFLIYSKKGVSQELSLKLPTGKIEILKDKIIFQDKYGNLRERFPIPSCMIIE